jgi:CheY-like chemotaxis protein
MGEIKVLIVDDDDIVRNLLVRLLRADGVTVLASPSPGEALELLERTSVEVVVSDYTLPLMTGIAFLDRVRTRWPWVHRILLSAHPVHALPEAMGDRVAELALDKLSGMTQLRQTIAALRNASPAPPASGAAQRNPAP